MIAEQINELTKDIHKNARNKGFYEGYDELDTNIVALVKLSLVHSEVSEVLEELRKPDIDMEKVAEEIADILIRSLDLAAFLKIDNIGDVTLNKHNVNKDRPYKHNKRF